MSASCGSWSQQSREYWRLRRNARGSLYDYSSQGATDDDDDDEQASLNDWRAGAL